RDGLDLAGVRRTGGGGRGNEAGRHRPGECASAKSSRLGDGPSAARSSSRHDSPTDPGGSLGSAARGGAQGRDRTSVFTDPAAGTSRRRGARRTGGPHDSGERPADGSRQSGARATSALLGSRARDYVPRATGGRTPELGARTDLAAHRAF